MSLDPVSLPQQAHLSCAALSKYLSTLHNLFPSLDQHNAAWSPLRYSTPLGRTRHPQQGRLRLRSRQHYEARVA